MLVTQDCWIKIIKTLYRQGFTMSKKKSRHHKATLREMLLPSPEKINDHFMYTVFTEHLRLYI